ncbi:hypothetical protein LZ32DRAFT_608872 [Colletotrichum eremochloae]|nr:hypothetical protein LZ32DRAFT_608872 [Colletotrichum eremochloae]
MKMKGEGKKKPPRAKGEREKCTILVMIPCPLQQCYITCCCYIAKLQQPAATVTAHCAVFATGPGFRSFVSHLSPSPSLVFIAVLLQNCATVIVPALLNKKRTSATDTYDSCSQHHRQPTTRT